MIPPIWLLKYLPNMLACHISILLDCQGPSNTITEAEAASNLAIGEAARIIARGRADVMITGGADSKIHPLSLVRMSLLDQMSHWQGEPSRRLPPVRPPPRRLGPRRGGGHPDPRGARARPGAGRQDLRRDPRLRLGLRRQPRRRARPRGGRHRDRHQGGPARRRARRPAEVGHVNAHGAATLVSDLAEARAFSRVFGAGGAVPVTALKGYFGNIVSGCGAVELIASLLGVNRGLIPPTLNCDEPDPAVRARPGPRRAPADRQPDLPQHQPHPPRPGRRPGRPRQSRPA